MVSMLCVCFRCWFMPHHTAYKICIWRFDNGTRCRRSSTTTTPTHIRLDSIYRIHIQIVCDCTIWTNMRTITTTERARKKNMLTSFNIQWNMNFVAFRTNCE